MRASSVWSLGVAVLMGAGAPMAAQAQAAPPLPEGVTQQMVDQGREIFAGAGLCANCHGPAGAGTAFAPSLADTVWLHGDGSFPAIVKTVTDGVLAPKASPIPMAPKGASSITEAQVRAVSAYVWRISHGL